MTVSCRRSVLVRIFHQGSQMIATSWFVSFAEGVLRPPVDGRRGPSWDYSSPVEATGVKYTGWDVDIHCLIDNQGLRI
ncbi:hypothetical protein B1C78_05080 [Thioalkalivibrio denitrificans]|uniref:Uncharacterized protein n=1 Tax=Thioalkalivibrio denitrificans TaxID=108003 RepID=A0A1V3NMV6_9GAMM|nr:hypothetical protein B1C78_05080 [Thioalkalivibrio denitrificans]